MSVWESAWEGSRESRRCRCPLFCGGFKCKTETQDAVNAHVAEQTKTVTPLIDIHRQYANGNRFERCATCDGPAYAAVKHVLHNPIRFADTEQVANLCRVHLSELLSQG